MSNTTIPWWELPEGGAHEAMTTTADDLRSKDEVRRLKYRIWDDLYEGRGLSPESYATLEAAVPTTARAINVARNAPNFVHSKCTAEIPTVRAAGHGADGGQRRRARQLSQFIAGVHDQLDLDGRISTSFLTALRTGTGVTKVNTVDGRIEVESCSPREFFVDPDDGRHGRPRVLYQVKQVDRRALAAQFPDASDDIMRAGPSADSDLGMYDPWRVGGSDTDAIDLYEVWVRPTGEERGRRLLAIQGRTLIDEDWEDDFPVAFLRPEDPRPGGGFWGLGMVEQLDGPQWEIDSLAEHIGRSIRENNLKIFVDDISDISKDMIADPTVGTIIPVAGGRDPRFIVPNAVSVQDIDYLNRLIAWAYQSAGLDEAAAAGAQSTRLSSGRAILFQHDMQTQRYVEFTKRIGQHVVDVVERILDAARRLSEDDPNWTVRFSRGSIVRQVDWSAVRMDRDEYVIELEEVSPIPDTFAGRMQQIEEDAAEGRIDPIWFAQLRQDPDLWRGRFQSARADADYVDHVIDQLLDPKAEMPRLLDEAPRQVLADALRTEILLGIVQDESPAVIARLQRYAQMLADDIERDQQQQIVPPPVPPAGGQGPGGAPPLPGGPPPA